MSPRPYQLGKRQESVDELRERVVDAARSLLGETRSYSEFTIDSVANRANVARATIYYQFDSKIGLVQAVCDALAVGGRLEDIGAAFAEPDPMESIRIVIRSFARFWDFDRTAMRRLRSLARLEPEVGELVNERDDRRRRVIEVFVDRLGGDPGRQPGSDLVRLLTVLTSFEMFDALADPPRTVVAAADDVIGLAEAAVTRAVLT